MAAGPSPLSSQGVPSPLPAAITPTRPDTPAPSNPSPHSVAVMLERVEEEEEAARALEKVLHTYMHAYMHAYMHTCMHAYIHA